MSQPRSSGLPYSEAEVAALRKHWAKGSRATLMGAMPGRSWSSIQYKAKCLKVRRGRVTPEVIATSWPAPQLAVLRKHYQAKGPKLVAEMLGRKQSTVGMMARKLGLYYQRPAPKPAPPRHPVAVKSAPQSAPQPTQHNPARKAANTLKPLLVTGAAAKTSPSTPNLNAQKAAVQRVRGQAAAKPADYVSAEMIRALKGDHPARVAYTRAAHYGMDAAQKAFHEAMKTAA